MRIFFLTFFIVLAGCESGNTQKAPQSSTGSQKKIKGINAPVVLDSGFIIRTLKFLASDTCEGRKPGSAGHELAAQRIVSDFRNAGVDSFYKGFRQSFTLSGSGSSVTGENIVAFIKGKKYPDSLIVISAHYDHLGKSDEGGIYYGADDNAGSVAFLLALAQYCKSHQPNHTVIFAAFDGEEVGLLGAKYFVQHLPQGVTPQNIKLNLNMDMIARSDKNEIYASGLNHYPALAFAVKKVQSHTTVSILTGHDSGSYRDDWTMQSDHYAFHKAHIPFLYIGVEDHEDYHQPSDTFDKINISSYLENCNMIALLLQYLDGK